MNTKGKLCFIHFCESHVHEPLAITIRNRKTLNLAMVKTQAGESKQKNYNTKHKTRKKKQVKIFVKSGKQEGGRTENEGKV